MAKEGERNPAAFVPKVLNKVQTGKGECAKRARRFARLKAAK